MKHLKKSKKPHTEIREVFKTIGAYITGSHAYGKVHEKSDIDLVVGVTEKDYKKLWKLSDKKDKLVFGKLNLVAFNLEDKRDNERFFKWRETHDDLCHKKPVSKQQAIDAFTNQGANVGYNAAPEQRSGQITIEDIDLVDELGFDEIPQTPITFGHTGELTTTPSESDSPIRMDYVAAEPYRHRHFFTASGDIGIDANVPADAANLGEVTVGCDPLPTLRNGISVGLGPDFHVTRTCVYVNDGAYVVSLNSYLTVQEFDLSPNLGIGFNLLNFVKERLPPDASIIQIDTIRDDYRARRYVQVTFMPSLPTQMMAIDPGFIGEPNG